MARKWWTLLAVCTGVFMLLLDITIVNVALPYIQQAFHASLADLQWVIDAYALTLAAFLLTAGSVADLVGRRRVFSVGGRISRRVACIRSAPSPHLRQFLPLGKLIVGQDGLELGICGLADFFHLGLLFLAGERCIVAQSLHFLRLVLESAGFSLLYTHREPFSRRTPLNFLLSGAFF